MDIICSSAEMREEHENEVLILCERPSFGEREKSNEFSLGIEDGVWRGASGNFGPLASIDGALMNSERKALEKQK